MAREIRRGPARVARRNADTPGMAADLALAARHSCAQSDDLGRPTILWLLIFLFHTTTPIDLQEREILAHADRSRPVHLITMADEIRLVEIAEQTPAQPRPIP